MVLIVNPGLLAGLFGFVQKALHINTPFCSLKDAESKQAPRRRASTEQVLTKTKASTAQKSSPLSYPRAIPNVATAGFAEISIAKPSNDNNIREPLENWVAQLGTLDVGGGVNLIFLIPMANVASSHCETTAFLVAYATATSQRVAVGSQKPKAPFELWSSN